MKKYAVTTTKFEGNIIYGYDDQGWLCLVEIDGVHEPHAHKTVCSTLPRTETDLRHWIDASKSMTITEVAPDLSFDSFWMKYNYKVGKSEAETAWKKLSDKDKAKAIQFIPVYDRHLKEAGTAKAYPQKYLNKRRFDDEY